MFSVTDIKIASICNLFGNYTITNEAVKTKLQTPNTDIINYIKNNTDYVKRDYSYIYPNEQKKLKLINFIWTLLHGAHSFITDGRKIMNAINTLLDENDYELSFYAYNNIKNNVDIEVEEYKITAPNKVNDAISKLPDHQKIFTNKQITIDVNWIR